MSNYKALIAGVTGAIGSALARELVSSLGAYAAICRELGAALDFPGPQGAYDSVTQVTNTDLLCRAIA